MHYYLIYQHYGITDDLQHYINLLMKDKKLSIEKFLFVKNISKINNSRNEKK